jgi:FAD/FMN-containing dehydrogenase
MVEPVFWRDESLPDLNGRTCLPFGLGRTLGDSCLNDGGTLLECTGLDRMIAFDPDSGVIRCEAGVTFAEILDFAVPRGWFLPTTPGTKFVTVGGAIANDVHGKNHHRVGTFGCHVTAFELLRSDGQRLRCSSSENADWFAATIGGLGLTGLITWAEFKLHRIAGPMIAEESVKFGNLEEFLAISQQSDNEFEHSVSWLDCLATGESLGRGIFMRGRSAADSGDGKGRSTRTLAVPVDMPAFLLNRYTMKAFNTLYYNRQRARIVRRNVHYDHFFYPLDAILHWNRIYGRRGYFQYQFVVPFSQGNNAVREILTQISFSGRGTFLAVMKAFGSIKSPGLLSFPRPGLTLALDFPNDGDGVLRLFDELDQVVLAAGGRLYPAKDSRMSAEMFQASYPEWREFSAFIDPAFSSSFWRRVTS